MHLIAPLASGIIGAENGTAQFLRRGTSTSATYYLDFEASNPIGSGVRLELDSNGGAEAYVNELVDVIVRDAEGAEVRSFVAGSAAPAVEVISESFTGTDYTTGAAAAGKPTTLQAVLDLWKTSAGTGDWSVLLDNVPQTIAAAIGANRGVYINVKAEPYSAAGDGLTDDTVALQTALYAAQQGGVVFFPRGTYRITTHLTMPNKVSLLGCGPAASRIAIDHANSNALLYPGYPYGDAEDTTTISGLKIDAMQANEGILVYAQSSYQRIVFSNCRIGSLLSEAAAMEVVLGDIKAVDCIFESASTSYVVGFWGGSFHARDCTFTPTLENFEGSVVLLVDGSLIRCDFELGSITTPGEGVLCVEGSGDVVVTHCDFGIPAAVGSTALFGVSYEGFNLLHPDMELSTGYTVTGLVNRTLSLSRVGRKLEQNVDANVLLDANSYDTFVLRIISDGNYQIALPEASPGAEVTLVIYNATALDTGSLTVTSFGDAAIVGHASFVIPSHQTSVYRFKRIVVTDWLDATKKCWAQLDLTTGLLIA